ncbi:DUF3006 domain-containing protein [Halobacteriales archaeon QS_5_70_17]|nr:MAG: DUF3006 domain-containing protein [Halobacteriales archaeon QS_5_70_17]
MTDGEYTAVVDRVEDGLAVLLLEADGETVDDLLVPPERLPRRARTAGAVLTVVVEDGDLIEARYRPEETRERAERAQSRFDRLAERPPKRDDRASEDDRRDGDPDAHRG